MRDHAVPCVNAHPSQVMRHHHYTFEDDRVCVRCRPSSAATSPGREAGESMASASPASSSLSWLPAARDAQQCAAGESPAPLAGNP